MRYLILLKAPAAADDAASVDPSTIEALAAHRRLMARAGVLLDAAGLQPSDRGWRIRHAGGHRERTDGPFVDEGGLVAGYSLIQVRSREEAVAWSERFVPPGDGAGCEIEVRPLREPPDAPAPLAAERPPGIDAP